MSTASYFLRISAHFALTCAESETSNAKLSALPPDARISSATAPQEDSLRLTQITVQPALASSRAISRPIPLPAPLTSATLSVYVYSIMHAILKQTAKFDKFLYWLAEDTCGGVSAGKAKRCPRAFAPPRPSQHNSRALRKTAAPQVLYPPSAAMPRRGNSARAHRFAPSCPSTSPRAQKIGFWLDSAALRGKKFNLKFLYINETHQYMQRTHGRRQG